MQADKLRDNANRALRALEGEDWFSESGGSMLASNDIAVMIRDLLAIAEAAEWQDIASAPADDSTQIVAWIPAKKFVGSMTVLFAVTAGASHWKPLSAPPALSTVVPVREGM